MHEHPLDVESTVPFTYGAQGMTCIDLLVGHFDNVVQPYPLRRGSLGMFDLRGGMREDDELVIPP